MSQRESRFQEMLEDAKYRLDDHASDVKRKTGGRAKRRFAAAKVKQKVVRNLKNNWGDWADKQAGDPKYVGKQAAVHGAACSCSMCGNPRRYSKGEERFTFQERRSEGCARETDWEDE